MPLADILDEVLKAHDFIKKRGQSFRNSQVEAKTLEKEVESFYLKEVLPDFKISRRRYKSLLQVARTIADLGQSKAILGQHIEKALLYSVNGQDQLRRIFS